MTTQDLEQAYATMKDSPMNLYLLHDALGASYIGASYHLTPDLVDYIHKHFEPLSVTSTPTGYAKIYCAQDVADHFLALLRKRKLNALLED